MSRNRTRTRLRAASGGQPRVVVSNGVMQLMANTRLQTPTGLMSSAIAADGASVVYYTASTPRRTGVNQWLLSEMLRINSVTESDPTSNWTTPGTAATATAFNVATPLAPDGNQTMARFTWTGAAAGPVTVRVPLSSYTPSTSYAASFWLRMVSRGGVTGLTTDIADGTASGDLMAQVVDGQTVRVVNTAGTTLPVSGIAGSNWLDINFTGYNGGTLDFYIWGAQAELSIGVPSSLIRSNGLVSPQRNNDLFSVALASLGISGTAGMTVLYRGRSHHPHSYNPTLLHIDDGTTNNRFFIDSQSNFGTVRVFATAAAVQAGGTSAGNWTHLTDFSLGYACDPATGRIAASYNGGAPVVVTAGAPVTGLTHFRLASRTNGANPWQSETKTCLILPYAMPDAALQSAVGALV